MAQTYTLTPVGMDSFSARVTKYSGLKVRKVQPHGCPRNGTFGHCYVETLGGHFVGLVLENSLTTTKGTR